MNTQLQPHQQRVVDEKQDLDLRIARLDEFMRRIPHSPRSMRQSVTAWRFSST